MKPSILFIVPAEYTALKIKGVEHMIFERDENGFFEKVITVHPLCSITDTIFLNDRHEIHEIGFDLIPNGADSKLLKYLQLPIHFVRIIYRIAKAVKKNRIDLIRATDPYWIGLFAYLGSRICKIPYCISIHADYDKRMALDKSISLSTVFCSYKLAKKLAGFVLSRASRVMPIRKTLGVKAVETGADPEKIRVIPHGIDLSSFNLPTTHNIYERFQIDSNLKIISFVGRLTKENYINDVLGIAERLASMRKDFIFVITGGGKEEKRVKTEVAGNSILNERILFTGFQPRDVCLDLRRTSYASLCLMAGFSLIEACAAARPIVSYDVEWHYELVKNKETGYLINEHDKEGATDALNWLLDHPEKCNEMGQNAKALAFEHHDLARTSAIKVKCYTEILLQGTDS